ncbi:MAG: hypothetical protein GX025_02740 [Clostridiales bacterium]|jgi:hypothetical protein|nr:hypothetical protein [Clostridiales bacterium]
MSDLMELAVQYRISGLACKDKLCELKSRLTNEEFSAGEIYELKRNITMLTAMSRDCIATSNYLKAYSERRERLERQRHSQS